ncbi:MAG: cell wall-binding repeat-containing protein, partial [Actinomycetota bacterium]|nr:cell wall-binding repeat-containing protein [Actinomycetota bacterium]
LQRFALATGENFADAVGGGLLMARYNGVVLTTPSNRLHPAAAAVLDARAFATGTGVLDVYVLGGPVAVAPGVVDALAARLNYLDKAASQ